MTTHDSFRPVPRPTALSQPFWDGCDRGVLLYQQCASCGTATFPAHEICRSCLSPDLRWTESSGTGSVYTFTVIHREPVPRFPVPTVLAIVDVDEGFSMFSNLERDGPVDWEIGARVEVRFRPQPAGPALPVFVAGEDR
ncbi:Zn-ribbon domain-containing OB-fold protein [Pseudonocardia ailaonensis]